MGFKADEDFLRFLTLGAVGCAAIARYLTREERHDVVELERYTMANKLWQTKVKRLRLPDLMCLQCGVRIEARAKSKLEIKLSESGTAGREWDAGLRDSDLVAFIQCSTVGGEVRPAPRPEVFQVGDLHESVSSSKMGPPKSASEGSERDRTWPSRVPSGPGRVLSVSGGSVRTQMASGRKQTYTVRGGIPAYVYLGDGEDFVGMSQFIVGSVRKPDSIECEGKVWAAPSDLDHADPISRYAAVKAVGLLKDQTGAERVVEIANSTKEDRRIVLEALGSLARIDPEAWTREIAATVRQTNDRALAMEAIFILTELKTEIAAELLVDLGSTSALSPEERAAAVWGLGATGAARDDLLIEFIRDPDDMVALHALVAAADLSEEAIEPVRLLLREGDRAGATAATLLARQGERGASALIESLGDDAGERNWAIYGLGLIHREVVERAAGDKLSPEILQALEPMWLGRGQNWLAADETSDQLRLLDRQLARPDPSEPD